MTAYTSATPFEFEGVKVWDVIYPGIAHEIHYDFGHASGEVPAHLAEVLHAKVEAERKAEKSPWQPVTFADVKVGDEIKSVSPCGTVRRGVVASVNIASAKDAEGLWLASNDSTAWPTYRRAPKFTLLDVLTVGQWIEATLRNGRVVVGEVADTGVPAECTRVDLRDNPEWLYVDNDPEANWGRDIISWRPTTPPAPEEPSGKYAVALDNALFAWTRNTYGTWVPIDNATGASPCRWAEFVRRFGPVTVLSQGVIS